MEVELREIEYEHFHDVIDLEVEKEQEKNLPSNLYSIAESSFSVSARCATALRKASTLPRV